MLEFNYGQIIVRLGGAVETTTGKLHVNIEFTALNQPYDKCTKRDGFTFRTIEMYADPTTEKRYMQIDSARRYNGTGFDSVIDPMLLQNGVEYSCKIELDIFEEYIVQNFYVPRFPLLLRRIAFMKYSYEGNYITVLILCHT